MQKLLIVAATLTTFVTPALAAEFYVAQDPETKKCKIVTEKPDGRTLIMIGTTSYPTYRDLQARSTALQSLAVFSWPNPVALSVPSERGEPPACAAARLILVEGWARLQRYAAAWIR